MWQNGDGKGNEREALQMAMLQTLFVIMIEQDVNPNIT